MAIKKLLNNEKYIPKISVITVVYNLIDAGREAHFRQLVESVHNQTCNNCEVEHVIIDGKSTDDTLSLIKEYANKNYFAYWSSESDTGIYDAMNKGVLAAKGKYVMFINSDDYLFPHAIKTSLEALEVAKADYSIADVQIQYKNNVSKIDIWRASMERTLLCQIPCHQGVVVKKDVFIECGMFDEQYKLSADVASMFELFVKDKKCVKVNEVITGFRDGGISGQNRTQSVSECVDICMHHYGKKLGLTRDEVFFLIGEDGIERWFLQDNRKRLFQIITKIKNAKDIKLAQELYFAILNLVFDDSAGRSHHKLSMAHFLDTPWGRVKTLPFKRKYAFLCTAIMKKLKLYWLIKPLRNVIVRYYENKQ